MKIFKSIIRRMGNVGIPIMGYNFSIAGVWGHVEGPYARGGAVSLPVGAGTSSTMVLSSSTTPSPRASCS